MRQNFDSSLNVKFSTYAVPMIMGEIRRFLRDNSCIRVSRSVKDTAYKAIYTKESIMIAEFIMDGMQAQIGTQSKARGIKEEEWFVVKNSNMPAVLIELGFLSNYNEAVLLNSDKYLKKATLGIYNGIAAFITHFERSRGFTSTK